MLRLFQTHQIRKQRELSGGLWDFATLPEDGTKPVAKKAFVPGCWECDPDTVSYRGRARYERDFFGGGNIRLELKGVSHTAEVYLDGEKIASHYNAYTPFAAVVTNLPEQNHHLQVVVDNSFGEQSALHVENDYQSYGGITRSEGRIRGVKKEREWRDGAAERRRDGGGGRSLFPEDMS